MNETTVKKDHWGKWIAETRTPLPGIRSMSATNNEERNEPAALLVSTYKDSRGDLVSNAIVIFITDSGHRTAIGGPTGDYSRTIRRERGARVTEKKLRSYHAESLGYIPQVVADLANHYNQGDPLAERAKAA
jgi:hypothetical protein